MSEFVNKHSYLGKTIFINHYPFKTLFIVIRVLFLDKRVTEN